MLRSVEEQHPETVRASEFGKFLLLLGWKLVNQSASTLSGEFGVPKKCRAICMLEGGPNSSMKSKKLRPRSVKVPAVGRIGVSPGIPTPSYLKLYMRGGDFFDEGETLFRPTAVRSSDLTSSLRIVTIDSGGVKSKRFQIWTIGISLHRGMITPICMR